MQKKIFTSLLMSPLAFGALAEITVNSDINLPPEGSPVGSTSWKPNGAILPSYSGDVIEGAIGIGKITNTIDVPCPGTYILKFSEASNIKVTLSDNVEPVKPEDPNASEVKFVASAACTVEITVEAETPNAIFKFGKCSLFIDCNFNELKKGLNTALSLASKIEDINKIADPATGADEVAVAAANNAKVVAGDLKQQADALTAKNTGDIDVIAAEIAALPDEEGSNALKLQAYKDKKLYLNPNPIQNDIDALGNTTKTLNTKIVNLNDNYPALVKLNAAVKKLNDDLSAETDKISEKTLKGGAAATLTGKGQLEVAMTYVNGECDETASSISEAISQYNDKIQSAYKDLTKTIVKKATPGAPAGSEVVFDPTTTIGTDISDFGTTVTEVVNNVKAYADLNGAGGLVSELKGEYDKAQATIIGISSLEGYPGVYSKMQSDDLSAIGTAYDDANAIFAKTTFENASVNMAEGAAANKDNANIAFANAKTKISETATKAKTTADDNNNAMTNALHVYADLETEFDLKKTEGAVNTLIDSGALTKEQQTEYNTKKTAVQTALGNLQSTLKTQYSASPFNTLKSEYKTLKETLDKATEANTSYWQQLQAVLTAIGDEDTADSWKGFLNGLSAKIAVQDELLALKAQLDKWSKDLDVVEPVSLADLFENNLISLQNAVNVTDADSQDTVSKAITDCQEEAKTLYNSIVSAQTAYKGFHDAILWLDKACQTQKLIGDNDTSYKTAYDAVQTAITKPLAYKDASKSEVDQDNSGFNALDTMWKAEFSAAVAKTNTPSQSYEAATALGDAIDSYDWSGKIDAAYSTYIDGLVNNNFNKIQTSINKIAKDIPTLNPTLPEGAKPTAYQQAVTDYGKIKEGDNDHLGQKDATAGIDKFYTRDDKKTACEYLIEQLTKLWGQSDVDGTLSFMNQNCVDYDTLIGLINAQIQSTTAYTCPWNLLDTYIKDNFSPDAKPDKGLHPNSPAYKKYKSLCDNLKLDFEALKGTLDTDLENLKVSGKMGVVKGTINGYTARNGLTGGSIYETIQANENAYVYVQEFATPAKISIITNLGNITSYPGYDELALGKQCVNELETLRDGGDDKTSDTFKQSLAYADQQTTTAYTNVECDAKKTILSELYSNVKNESQNIWEKFNGGWNAAVQANNDDLLNSSEWQSEITNMNLEYSKAVNAYNGYTGLNAGYTASPEFVKASIDNANLFKDNVATAAHVKNVETAMNAATAAGMAITKAQFEKMTVGVEEGEDPFSLDIEVEENGKKVIKTFTFDSSTSIINNINASAQTMIVGFNEAGKVYYEGAEDTEGLLSEAEAAYNAKYNLLVDTYDYSPAEAANILQKYSNKKAANQNEENGLIYQAIAAYNAAKAVTPPSLANYKTTVGYAMSNIADMLDKVINMNLNPQVIASKWNPTYKLYNEGTKNIAADAEGYIKGFDNLETELKGYNVDGLVSTYVTSFKDNKKKAVDLNAKITAANFTENLLAIEKGQDVTNIDKYINELKGYYAAALQNVADAKIKFDNNKKQTDFDDALTTDMNALTSLQEQIITLGGCCKDDNLVAIEKLIEDAATDVTEFNNKLSDYKDIKDPEQDDKDLVQGTLNDAYDSLKSASEAAYDAENEYLADLVNDLQVAYNDAFAVNEAATTPYRETVTNCMSKQETLAKAKYPVPADKVVAGEVYYTPEEYYSEASSLENTISENIAKLNGIGIGAGKVNSLQAAKDALGEAYTEAENAINTAKNALPTAEALAMVKDQYSPEYDNLLTLLAEVKSSYESAGTSVIAQQPYYISRLNAISVDSVKSVKREVSLATTQAGYYNDIVKNQWNPVNDKYTDLDALATLYGVSDFKVLGGGSVTIGQSIANIKTDLDALITNEQKTGIKDLYDQRKLGDPNATKDPFKIDFGDIEDQINLETLVVKKNYGYSPYDEYNTRSKTAAAAIDELSTWLNDLAKDDFQLVPGSLADGSSISVAINKLLDRLTSNDKAIKDFIPEEYIVLSTPATQAEEEGGSEETVDKNFTTGNVAIDGILKEYAEIIKEAEDLLKQGEESYYKLGDLNNDGYVNVGDLVKMRQLILDKTTIDSLLESENPVDVNLAYAANIVGDNTINIADYTALVNIIVNSIVDDDEEDAPATSMKKMSRQNFYGVAQSIEAEGSISIQAVAEENGVRTYAISISNPETFVAGQLDLLIESTSRIVDVRGAERLENHDVDFQTDSKSTRVLISSFDNAEFEGTEGVTLYVDVEGRSGLGFENAIFADETAQTYTFSNQAPVTTGVDSLYEGAKAVKEAIYDAAGRMMKSVQRGINIIRNSNGTVTKEMHK